MNRTTRAAALAVVLATTLSVPVARAGLFIAKDSWMVMGMVTPDTSNADLFYGLTRDWSVGAGVTKLQSNDKSIRHNLAYGEANYLVGRLFHENGVGNLYVMGAAGTATGNDFSGNEALGGFGIWIDYETRRIYSKFTSQVWKAPSFTNTITTVQLGFAPYAADYEEVALWFVVQAQRRSGLSDTTQVTPMLRVIRKDWWVEIGASTNSQNRGEVFFNLMHTF